MVAQRKTILHAEDTLRWRKCVKALLSERYNVVSTVDFDSTLDRLAKGGIDLLILDHLMPGKSPLDDACSVFAYLRQKYPGLPVIVLTGALVGSSTTREEFAQMVGAPTVLKKDVVADTESFRNRIDEYLM